MKKQRTKKIVSLVLACLMLLSLVLFTGCNSAEDPVDNKYTGLYSNPVLGSKLYVERTGVYSDWLYLPQAYCQGRNYGADIVSFNKTAFDYLATDDISVRPYVSLQVAGVKGYAYYEAKIEDKWSVWRLTFYYYGNKNITMEKAKK